jgi:hypothetical protein
MQPIKNKIIGLFILIDGIILSVLLLDQFKLVGISLDYTLLTGLKLILSLLPSLIGLYIVILFSVNKKVAIQISVGLLAFLLVTVIVGSLLH